MDQGFFQFNSSLVNEITDFIQSPYGIFFLSGPKGSSKSETIEKIIPDLSEDNFIFRHFCFENSTIDDFLLNFYDALKDFSLSGKLSLKKFVGGDFKEKVTHYFKTIEKNCIIIVENYEKVERNNEIADFLIHLSNFSNVKIIIISRNNNVLLHSMGMQTKTIEQISKEDFKVKLNIFMQSVSDEIKERFYEITQGLELYLNMSIKYCTNTGISLTDLINEFERREQDNYERFIVSKFSTLTPSNYRDLFNILSCLSHPVSINFIDTYRLGNPNYIDYLSKNFLVSKFGDEIYVKDYFKEYVKDTITVQEKVNYYNKLIEIYEKELTKSPKDRLLRLSRESIRKEIELFKILLPSINSQSQKPFSYIGISSFDFSNNQKPKNTLSEKLKKIQERKNKLSSEDKNFLNSRRIEESRKTFENENKQKTRNTIVDLINQARNLSQNYKYSEALNVLLNALDNDFDNEFKIELCCLIAKDYELLNEYDNAQNYYQQALNCAIDTNDSRICEIRCDIASMNKKLYKTDIAKEQFIEITAHETYSDKYRAIASIELGEIEEAQGNIETSAKHYENALALCLGTNKNLCAKAYYRLAVLYDENGDVENAVKYYKKNYMLSAEHYENEYYSISLTNLASIYSEQSKYQEASEFLKLALAYDTENNDLENIYYSQKELAKLYSQIDITVASSYYKQALQTAKELNDSFKSALVYFEAGEFYYDKAEDEKALECFFSARKELLNNPKDENVIRINSRIEDIKMRLNSVNFNIIAEKFN